jgi:hypothetical protein
MANWYNQVFEKAPEKGAPLRLNELPTVIDPGNIDENLEAIMKNKLDSVFSNKYNFKQLPTNTEDRKTFLNNAKSRELNPAGLPTTIYGDAFQMYFQAEVFTKDTLWSAWDGFTYLGSYFSAPFTQKSAVTGGSSQKKMPHYNKHKTQRKR